MIGADHAVARIDRGAFNDRQDIPLDAFSRDVRAVSGFAAGNLVNLIDEENPHLFDAIDGKAGDLIHVNEAVFFFLN
jgi:hypothetical protein